MREIGAVIGGEGSGGVILPAMHYGRDAVVGIGLILQELAEFDGPLSSFRSTLPRYEIRKSKIDLSKLGAERIFSSLGQHYGANGNIDTRDGLKINFEDSWVHLRTSNTEPILRIIAEAPSANRAEDLIRQFRKEILSLQ
jgi:phosphomannomutase